MRGAEDVACAEYIGALLQDQPVDAIRAVSWVDSFRETRLKVKRMDIQRQYEADVKLCAVIDRFSFAMRVDREQGLLVMRPAAGGQASAQ
jgi:2-phosphosulfolactate phosphatase